MKNTAITLFLILVAGQYSWTALADEACYSYRPGFGNGSIDDPPRASSFLRDAKDPGRYSANKAFDGNPATSWVEGRDDDGIGEKIGFTFSKMNRISLLPGFGDARYFSLNNRVKRATLKIYEVAGVGAHQCGVNIGFEKLVKTLDLKFRDLMEMQEFHVGLDREAPRGYVGVLEIVEVFRGSRWRDTCIAEIKIIE